jgi:predicted TIM-barrel fold metal-dependent hydrolase
MIIDAHSHPDWNGHNFERVVENMQKYNIDKSWLLPRECPDDEVHIESIKAYTPGVPGVGQMPFSRCVSYAERAPEKFVLGFSPDPRKTAAIGQLEAAVDIYNVKICGEIKLRMMYDNLDAVQLYKFCAGYNLPVVLHLENPNYVNDKMYWYGGGILVLKRILQMCPDTIFVGHGPGFWSYISDDDQKDSPYPSGKIIPGGLILKLLQEFPNLYCDMSAASCKNALSRDIKFSQEFCDEFQDRLLFGRDNFSNEMQKLIEVLNLSNDVKNKIYSANALTLTA